MLKLPLASSTQSLLPLALPLRLPWPSALRCCHRQWRCCRLEMRAVVARELRSQRCDWCVLLAEQSGDLRGRSWRPHLSGAEATCPLGPSPRVVGSLASDPAGEHLAAAISRGSTNKPAGHHGSLWSPPPTEPPYLAAIGVAAAVIAVELGRKHDQRAAAGH